jgi:hypothetical protein
MSSLAATTKESSPTNWQLALYNGFFFVTEAVEK